jgi:hypothetical protein
MTIEELEEKIDEVGELLAADKTNRELYDELDRLLQKHDDLVHGRLWR